MKRCKGCRFFFPFADFYRHKQTKDGHTPKCKQCIKDRANRARRKNNVPVRTKPGLTYSYTKEYRTNYSKRNNLRVKYNLSEEQIDFLLASVSGVCDICGNKQYWAKRTSLVVDHCHATGRIRGFLCHSCNVAIGNLKENIATMNAAISYLTSDRDVLRDFKQSK